MNGNLIAKTARDSSVDPDWTYEYTIIDELEEVRRNGSRVAQYRYDALGRRDANGPSARTYLIFDGPDRVIDIETGNAFIGPLVQERRYIHGAYTDQPVAMETFVEGSTAPLRELSFHGDHLGSIRFLTDESGQVVNEYDYDYDAYGRPEIISELFPQPFLYTAREWEPDAELYHYRVSTQRFLLSLCG